jgi:hypothetical protein
MAATCPQVGKKRARLEAPGPWRELRGAGVLGRLSGAARLLTLVAL